jgi:Zn-dependent protease
MDLIQFLVLILALIVTLTVHEASHALAAYYLGDPTAKMKGRLTLNPLAHLDLLGSLVFLITQRIGWGKPVPVNPANFKNPVRDNGLTSLAGPMSNFVLAFAVALPWKYLGGYLPDFVTMFLQMIFHVSIFLGIFNFFPFPPLDGANILGLFIPKKYHRIYHQFLEKGARYFIAIILVDVLILSSLIDFSFFGYVMRYLHGIVSTVLLLGT